MGGQAGRKVRETPGRGGSLSHAGELGRARSSAFLNTGCIQRVGDGLERSILRSHMRTSGLGPAQGTKELGLSVKTRVRCPRPA